MYNADFGKDVLHSDIQYEFLREYYTRTYSKIFNFILYSDVQYDFYTALERTVRFYTVLGRTIQIFEKNIALDRTV